ncbi:Rna binding protein [Lotmaria passim]
MMPKSPCVYDSTNNTPRALCCGTITPTTNNMLCNGLTNSASEKPLSESSTSSCPRISGVAAEFWGWFDDPANLDWAIATFPVERGYSDRNIFVTRLPPSFQDRDLQSMFENFGEVVSAKVMLNVSTGVSKETGFVQFATSKDALRARSFLRLRPAVTVPPMPEVGTQWAQNKHDGGVYGDRSRLARKLFIRNIPASVTNEEMRALVTPFGEVAEVTLHADTYDAGVAASSARGTDSSEEAASGEAAATTPPATKRSMRICFVTFAQPGVAARACAAIHNTKPFHGCGEIPLMAKIAEDNHARQARHQQGAMHRSDIRAVAAAPYNQRSPLSVGNGQRTRGNCSSTANAGWLGVPQQSRNGGGDAMCGNVAAMIPQQQPPQMPVSYRHELSSAISPFCSSQVHSCSNGNGVTPLVFQSCEPRTEVAALDPAALASSSTPCMLPTTALPTMKTSAVPNSPAKSPADHSRRPSLLTRNSTMSSVKARIPVTTTSAPTSARRASCQYSKSPLFHVGAVPATSPTLSACASGNFSSENFSSPGLPFEQTQQMAEKEGEEERMGDRRSNSAAAAVQKTTVAVSPRKSPATALSSQSSDTALTSHGSSSHDGDDAAEHHINVHVSLSRRYNTQTKAAQARASHSTPTTQRSSPRTSPYLTAQVVALPHVGPVPPMTMKALTLDPPSLSMSHSGLERAATAMAEAIGSPYSSAATAMAEAIGSPYSSASAGNHNTPNISPTHPGSASHMRYRNNPYGMNVVMEKTRSSSFTEA